MCRWVVVVVVGQYVMTVCCFFLFLFKVSLGIKRVIDF